ncbi:hypothetical protein EDB85DRAFT_1916941 [Lactarius pseudohatsudake]|nr:hypothetical protein EDB85DRAFT_1916941 [Lactarius pseudohatsudake]
MILDPPVKRARKHHSRCDIMQVRAPPFTSGSVEVANDTLVAAVSISVYDYVLTLPAEYRFYRAFYRNNYRLSTNLVLFVLIRYVSILVLVLGAIGFWSTFSPDSCRRFYLLPISARVHGITSDTWLANILHFPQEFDRWYCVAF